jgi:hypothetical protein
MPTGGNKRRAVHVTQQYQTLHYLYYNIFFLGFARLPLSFFPFSWFFYVKLSFPIFSIFWAPPISISIPPLWGSIGQHSLLLPIGKGSARRPYGAFFLGGLHWFGPSLGVHSHSHWPQGVPSGVLSLWTPSRGSRGLSI